MKKVIIYGCGFPGIPFQIECINKNKAEWEVAGYIDDGLYKTTDTYEGYPIFGGENVIPKFVEKGYYFFNNIASKTDFIETIANRLATYNAKICTLIVPTPPFIDPDTVNIGKGSHISPLVTITGPTSIGKHVIIRQNAVISHDSNIGDFCFIGPRATLLGRINVGKKTFIGAGALIKDRVTIGENCTIGMGTVVLNDLPDNTKVFGNPAKKMLV